MFDITLADLMNPQWWTVGRMVGAVLVTAILYTVVRSIVS